MRWRSAHERPTALSLPPFPPDTAPPACCCTSRRCPRLTASATWGRPRSRGSTASTRRARRWWQALPLGPTGYGDSPYQSLSSFAGNGLLISPDWLIEDGLLRPSDCDGHVVLADAPSTTTPSSRSSTGCSRRPGPTSAPGRARTCEPAFEQFCREQAHWLDDYALFRALKASYDGAHYLEWPAELVQREPAALAQARRDLASQVDQVRFAQFLLFRQADRLKEHAHASGVRLIGDLPFFVSPDSSDVWANPELFLLDEQRRPRFVAGVPPDYFSADGQLWGNPVYDWDALRASGYRWCIDRLRALLAHVDVIRLDHFRGFAAAWHVPAGAPTARAGQWVPGPGRRVLRAPSRRSWAACRSSPRTWG